MKKIKYYYIFFLIFLSFSFFNKKYIIKNFLTKSIKDTTANLISEDETLVMKSKKIISLMYDKDISSIQ